MKTPQKVAHLCKEMDQGLNVSVKCRIGVDNHDSYEEFRDFIKCVSEEGGVTKFVIHARKAFLQGLNPKENRSIPPLKYSWVYSICNEFPHLKFVINGGFDSLDKVKEQLKHAETELSNLEGVMCGRLIMNNPYTLAQVDSVIFGEESKEMCKEEILRQYTVYAEKEYEAGVPRSLLIKPILNLFSGEVGSTKFKQKLNEPPKGPLTFDDIVYKALMTKKEVEINHF